MVPGLLFSTAMPASEPTVQLRRAVRRPGRRGEIAIAATVLCASASGGVLVALLQPRVKAPAVLTLPVPTAIAMPRAVPSDQRSEPPPSRFDVAPVIAEGGLRVVLATEVEPQWLGDSIQVSDHDGVRVAVRPLSQRGEQRFAGQVASVFRLYGRDARLCTAEVTGLVAVGRFAPDDFGEAEAPVSAAAAWSAADGAHLIAADQRPIAGDCAGALWAQPEALAEAVRATVSDASGNETRRAGELLRATSGFSEATQGSHATIEVQAVALPGGERLLVASALVEGCAELEPVTTAVYAVQADGSLHQVAADLDVSSIAAAADFDGDGAVEILVHTDALDLAVLRRRAAGYQVEAHAALPIYGCRC